MKTTIMSLLLAAVSTAAAQDRTATQPGESAEVQVFETTSGSAAEAATDEETTVPSSGSSTSFVIPARSPQQVVDPVNWNYTVSGRDGDSTLLFHTRKGPVTFLGVSTSSPSQELAAQLAVDEDTGLVVDAVTVGSPAEKAGIQAKDVLTRLDDQILILPRQLAILVANHKEGDSVTVSLIRKGQPQDVTVVLSKQEGALTSADDLASRFGQVGIVVDGKLQQPLRTFTRRFQLTEGDLSRRIERMKKLTQSLKSIPNDDANAAEAVAKGLEENAAEEPEEKSVQDELKDIRQALDALTKKLNEVK